MTVITGPSGSGKSSLAFHTLYAEGQRRYVETFSPYVRQFFDRMDKPNVDRIDGIPPAIAIEQKNAVRTTRSTVGTITEINDYLKLLYPLIAKGYDPKTGEEIRPNTPDSATHWCLKNLAEEKVLITFPIPVPEKTTAADFFPFLNSQGYLRILIRGEIHRTDEPDAFGKKKLPRAVQVIQDRLTVPAMASPSDASNSRLTEALEAAFRYGKGHATVNSAESGPAQPTPKEFSTTWSPLRKPTSSLFSFNNPLGACPSCRGFGRVIGIDLNKSVPDGTLSLTDGAIKPFQGERGDECQRDLLRCAVDAGIDCHTPYNDFTEDEKDWIMYGEDRSMAFSDHGQKIGEWYGVKGFFDWLETKSYKMHVRIFLSRYRSYTTCSTCRGRRLQPDALAFRIENKTLPDLWKMSAGDLSQWFSELPEREQESEIKKKSDNSTNTSLKLVLTEITNRLHYLDQVGLSYLSLDRATRTLSGGEIERVIFTV